MSDNLCQKLPGDEFPAEIWQISDTGFNWVRAHSQNFVLVLGMRISFKDTLLCKLNYGIRGPTWLPYTQYTRSCIL